MVPPPAQPRRRRWCKSRAYLGRDVSIGLGVSICRVTAKETLLERAPHWTEEQAARALRAAEGELDDWGDLHAQTGALAEQAETRLRERERAAGDGW